ncbi:hypothetical protein PYH37_005224 [Sinorhizobium numidicum]|uniref:Uncharacterized protein n=1 Tax=Sinorhizobium numidicum TaxID=680248 RepID=A0ABY8D3D1_9HYPH|nr:hypothetical protein [Sinorhizobium numidicum]WEX76873.1 hypothetical protein PYH37_005224 [Sinorhizobium numidicum]WEX83533.1 hypothetical protein PYH38_002317 [Sinorhizobium numidicum]
MTNVDQIGASGNHLLLMAGLSKDDVECVTMTDLWIQSVFRATLARQGWSDDKIYDPAMQQSDEYIATLMASIAEDTRWTSVMDSPQKFSGECNNQTAVQLLEFWLGTLGEPLAYVSSTIHSAGPETYSVGDRFWKNSRNNCFGMSAAIKPGPIQYAYTAMSLSNPIGNWTELFSPSTNTIQATCIQITIDPILFSELRQDVEEQLGDRVNAIMTAPYP